MGCKLFGFGKKGSFSVKSDTEKEGEEEEKTETGEPFKTPEI